MDPDGIIIIDISLCTLVALFGDWSWRRLRRQNWALPASIVAYGVVAGVLWVTTTLAIRHDSMTIFDPQYPNVMPWVRAGFLTTSLLLISLGGVMLYFREWLFRTRLKRDILRWRNEKRHNEWCDHLTPAEHHVLTKNVCYIERRDRYEVLLGVGRFERWQLSHPALSLTQKELRRIVNATPSVESSMTRSELLAAQLRRKYLRGMFGWLRS